MHNENFDKNSVGNFPLTIDRMAELQGDLQTPMKLLAEMLPAGDCIVAGCLSAGAAGYVRMNNEDGLPEIFEVRGGSGAGAYMVMTETNTTVENSDGAEVTVRTERYLTWSINQPEQGSTYVAYADLPRVWVTKGEQDDVGWTACNGGTWWRVPLDGTSLRVQRTGGRTHLWGSVKYGLKALLKDVTIYEGVVAEVAAANNVVITAASNVHVLPDGYHPDGDVLIPVRYNGAVSHAIIDSQGQLLLRQNPELGDTLVIDTWL